MTRLPYALMLTAAVCLLSAPVAHAAQRGRAAQRQAEPSGESSPPARAVPRAEAPRPAPDRGEAARPAPESGRGASSAGRERGVDNAGRSRIPPPRLDEGRTERTPDARARAPRPADTSNGSNTEQVNADEGRRPNDSPRTGAVVPRWPIGSPAGVTRTGAVPESADDDQGRAVPRGSRPRADNPPTGTAVARPAGVPHGGGDRRGSTVYVPRGRAYNNYYYYYPRHSYPYGYGAFGLGYFYYDPYSWYGYDPYWSYGYPYYGGTYGGYPYGGYGGYRNGHYEIGELRLQVEPRHAEVYVDGYFAGHVDDFDGIFQSLTLEDGPHKIEIVAPGFETLAVDVRILPGRKVTYKGALKPRL